MRSSLLALWVFAAIGVPRIGSPADTPLPKTPDEAKAYLQKLYESRAAITSGYVKFVQRYQTLSAERSLEGSERTYAVWFDQDRFRWDLKETRPKDRKSEFDTRYAYSDGVYRIIDVNRPNFAVREFTKEYLGGKEPGAVPVTRFDVRLVGVLCGELGILQHRRLDALQDFGESVTVERVEYEGRPAARINVRHPKGRIVSYILLESTLLPVALRQKGVNQSPDGQEIPDIRVEIDSEIQAWPNGRGETFEFPQSMRIRRFADGTLETEESLTFQVVNLNVPVDPNDLTWKALAPPKGALLTQNGEDKWNPRAKSAVLWNGERFEVTRYDPFAAAGPTRAPNSGVDRGQYYRMASYILLALAVVFAGAFAFVWFGRRRRAAG